MKLYKPAINWGVKMGIANILIFLIIYAIDPMFFGSTKGWIVSFAVTLLAVPIVFMILGARDTKANFSPYKFGNAFNAAFITAVVSAVIVFLFNIIFLTVIDPTWEQELYEEVARNTETLMEDMGTPQEAIDQTIEKMKEDNANRTTGVLGAAKQTGIGLFWYAILALVIGAVQKSKKDEEIIEIEDLGN